MAAGMRASPTVHPDFATMTERATRLRAEVAGGTPTDELLAAVDNVLVDGYALALTGDAWSMRAGRRLHDLITQTGGSDRDRPRATACAPRRGRVQRDCA
jgi:hypothetical protein